jgi:hypothetical protein
MRSHERPDAWNRLRARDQRVAQQGRRSHRAALTTLSCVVRFRLRSTGRGRRRYLQSESSTREATHSMRPQRQPPLSRGQPRSCPAKPYKLTTQIHSRCQGVKSLTMISSDLTTTVDYRSVGRLLDTGHLAHRIALESNLVPAWMRRSRIASAEAAAARNAPTCRSRAPQTKASSSPPERHQVHDPGNFYARADYHQPSSNLFRVSCAFILIRDRSAQRKLAKQATEWSRTTLPPVAGPLNSYLQPMNPQCRFQLVGGGSVGDRI